MIDSHCHFSELSDDEIQAQLQRAAEAGVQGVVVIGSGHGMKGNRRAIDITQGLTARRGQEPGTSNFPGLCCSLGIHPHEAQEAQEDDIQKLTTLIKKERGVVAVGEIGLDFHYDLSPRDEQEKVFRRFLQIAQETQKPVIIHDRECQDLCPKIIREEKAFEHGGVAHCFSGDEDLARKYLDLGFYISFSGVITFKKADVQRAVAKWVPLDRVLVETDAPFLAPVPHRGKKNEPAFVVHTAKMLAQIKGMPYEKIAAQVSENARTLFNPKFGFNSPPLGA